MSEYSDTFSTMLNYLTENPLMDSCTVYVDDIKNISNVADEIKTQTKKAKHITKSMIKETK